MAGITIANENKLQTAKPIQINMAFEGEPNFELIKEIQKDIEAISKALSKLPSKLANECRFDYKKWEIDIITLNKLRDMYRPDFTLWDSCGGGGIRKELYFTIDCKGLRIVCDFNSVVINLNMDTKKP